MFNFTRIIYLMKSMLSDLSKRLNHKTALVALAAFGFADKALAAFTPNPDFPRTLCQQECGEE